MTLMEKREKDCQDDEHRVRDPFPVTYNSAARSRIEKPIRRIMVMIPGNPVIPLRRQKATVPYNR
jgi:hypothetical protein